MIWGLDVGTGAFQNGIYRTAGRNKKIQPFQGQNGETQGHKMSGAVSGVCVVWANKPNRQIQEFVFISNFLQVNEAADHLTHPGMSTPFLSYRYFSRNEEENVQCLVARW